MSKTYYPTPRDPQQPLPPSRRIPFVEPPPPILDLPELNRTLLVERPGLPNTSRWVKFVEPIPAGSATRAVRAHTKRPLPNQPRLYTIRAGAVTWLLQASSVGSGPVTANQTLITRLGGIVTGTSSVTAHLRETVAMVAASIGSSTVTANLTAITTQLLQAVVNATSAVSAFLGGLLGTIVQMPNRYQEWGQAVREDSGKTHTDATVSAAGGTSNAELACDGYNVLVLLARMTGAADANLAVSVRPYEDDGTTLFDLPLTVSEAVGPTHVSGVVRYIGNYNVRGLAKVQVRVTNNHASQQTANVVYHLRSGG